MSPPSPDSRVRLSVTLGHVTYVGRDYGYVRIPLTVGDVRFMGGHLISLHHTTVGPAESKRWAVTCQGHLVTSATYWQIIMEARSLVSFDCFYSLMSPSFSKANGGNQRTKGKY